MSEILRWLRKKTKYITYLYIYIYFYTFFSSLGFSLLIYINKIYKLYTYYKKEKPSDEKNVFKKKVNNGGGGVYAKVCESSLCYSYNFSMNLKLFQNKKLKSIFKIHPTVLLTDCISMSLWSNL